MRSPSATRARCWAAVTVLVGAVITARPAAAGGWAAGPDRPPPAGVVRALGVREVLQGIVIAMRPTRTVVGVAALVDLIHALSMAVTPALIPHYRRPAAISGAAAAVSAAVGGLLVLPRRPR